MNWVEKTIQKETQRTKHTQKKKNKKNKTENYVLKGLILLVLRKMQIKTLFRHHLTPAGMAIINESES